MILELEIHHTHKNVEGHFLPRETCGNIQPNSTRLMFLLNQEDMDLGIQ